jgi:hypothetical protein
VAEQIASLRDSADRAVGLRGLVRALLAQVTQPRVMQLHRLVTGEAGRFPGTWPPALRQRPGRTIDTLAATPKAWLPGAPCGWRTRG